MAYEIERKFLVKNDSYKKMAYESKHLIQGYICKDSMRTVRIRIADNLGFITIKGKSTQDGLTRYEWEKEISVDDAFDLMKLCDGNVIDKIRYKIKSGAFVFEVDEFFGDNQGLVMAEVELSDVSDSPIFPDFLGEEVTGDKRYYNSYIVDNPYKNWMK